MYFGRIITAMVTPFDSDLKVNFSQVEKLAKKLVEEGTDTILIAGTTGESPTLTLEEKFQLLKVVKDVVGNEAKVIVGTGTNNTKSAIKLSQQMENMGADGLLVVAPYYNKPPQEALYNHFKLIAESVSIPVIIYNIPSRTGINILPQTIYRLSKIDNIIGVKEASGSVAQVIEIAKLTDAVSNKDIISEVKEGIKDMIDSLKNKNSDSDEKRAFYIYSGDDALTLPFLSVGACGVVSVASHLVGKDIKLMIKSFFEGDVQKARKINEYLNKLFKALFITTNPIPVKAALNLMGYDVGSLRLPLMPISDDNKKYLKEVLKEYNLI